MREKSRGNYQVLFYLQFLDLEDNLSNPFLDIGWVF